MRAGAAVFVPNVITDTALFEDMQRQSITLDTVMNNAMTSACDKGQAKTAHVEDMQRQSIMWAVRMDHTASLPSV